MKIKILFIFIAIFLLSFMAIFFLTNPSYQKSIQAKYYYETGDYTEAYTLANQAFSLDIYNRMAATIMAQSKISLKYIAYNDEAAEYLKTIGEMVQTNSLDDAQRAKIKLMSEIMVESYFKLAPSVVTDKTIVEKAAQNYEEFTNILNKLN